MRLEMTISHSFPGKKDRLFGVRSGFVSEQSCFRTLDNIDPGDSFYLSCQFPWLSRLNLEDESRNATWQVE